jgi:hypothetical protein
MHASANTAVPAAARLAASAELDCASGLVAWPASYTSSIDNTSDITAVELAQLAGGLAAQAVSCAAAGSDPTLRPVHLVAVDAASGFVGLYGVPGASWEAVVAGGAALEGAGLHTVGGPDLLACVSAGAMLLVWVPTTASLVFDAANLLNSQHMLGINIRHDLMHDLPALGQADAHRATIHA